VANSLRFPLTTRRAGLLLLGAVLAGACHKAAPPQAPGGDPLQVKVVEQPLVVSAWAEPKSLPPGGGEAQILVRIQRPGSRPFKGVEVRLQTSEGTLFSAGRVLVTDGRGMTRDRLTTTKTATITLNAGGTRYRFPVPVEKRRR
jgi:hypothetical protein